LPRITAIKKTIILLKVTAIEKTIPAEAKAFKEEFGATYREIRGHGYLKKPRVKRIPAEAKTLKKEFGATYRKIRGHDTQRNIFVINGCSPKGGKV